MNTPKLFSEEDWRTSPMLGMNDPGIEEIEVLAAMMIDPDAIPEIAKHLVTTSFYYFRHQVIFDAILGLHKSGLPVDEVTLPNELQRCGHLTDAGGVNFIIDVLARSHPRIDYMGVVALVRAHSRRREMLLIAQQLAEGAYRDNRDTTEQALKQAQKLIAPPASRTRWVIMPASELKNLPAIEWLLPGLIPARGLTALYGRSGEGKSFYALDLCLRLAQSYTVVYIAAEGQSGYTKRVAAWTIHFKQGEGQLHFCMGAVNMMEAADLRDFIEALRQYNPALVCVDTLARTMLGGNENDTRDMGLYVDACSQITEQIGCAVLLVHHMGKTGYSARGSTALIGACEQMIELSKEDDVIRVRLSKNKDDNDGQAFYLSPVEVQTPYGNSIVLVPRENIVRANDDALTQSQKMILTTLRQPINLEGAKSSDLEEQTGLTRPTIAHALNRLIERRFVERKALGVYGLTANGLTKIRSLDPVDPVDPAKPMNLQDDQDEDTLNSQDQEDQLDQPELFSDGKRVFYP